MTQRELNTRMEQAISRGDLDTAEHFRSLMERSTVSAVASDLFACVVTVAAIALALWALSSCGGVQ